MGLFNNKSGSEKALHKFLARLPKYLKKPDVDWSRKLYDELPRLGRGEKHNFLSNYGHEFFAHIREACAHDDRRLNFLPELMQRLIGYQDEEDLIIRRIFAEDLVYIVSQINQRGCLSDHAKLSVLMLARDGQEIDRKAGRKCGFLTEDQRERLVFGLLDRMADEYQKKGKYSYASNVEGLLCILRNVYSDEDAQFSRKITDKMLANSELFNHKRYFECVLNILSAQGPEVCAEGLSTIQNYIERTIDKHQLENNDEGLALIADKIKTLADTGYVQDYRNAVVKPRAFIRYKNKADCSALVVRFNEVSSDKGDHVLFVEQIILGADHAEGTVKIDDKNYTKTPRSVATYRTSDIRATLVEHYDMAGEILADKLEEKAPEKPIKNARIAYIV